MTRDEFITAYCKRSNIERTELGHDRGKWQYVAMRCACGDEVCEGWAMVKNDPENIATHLFLYSPDRFASSQGAEREALASRIEEFQWGVQSWQQLREALLAHLRGTS